jgi:MFS transporter, PPP family, 3-phenylpropionic acid transporter
MPRLTPLLALLTLYVALYSAFGVASPFWPHFFETRGLTAQEIGLLLGLGTFVRLIVGPFFARFADLHSALRAVLAFCIMTSAVTAVGLTVSYNFWWLLPLHLTHSTVLAPVTTLADALAVRASVRPPRFQYGWVRGAGSAAFISGTLLAGQILAYKDVTAVICIYAALLVGAVLGAAMAPESDTKGELAHDLPAQSSIGGILELLKLAPFRRMIMVAALVYGSHAMHDAFSVIRWTAAGLSPVTISVLWSESVLAEVVVFILIGPALLRRLGVNGAATLAAAAGVVRWIVEAYTVAIWPLAFVQPLHGFTFSLLHLACMKIIADTVPAHLAATAQSLYAIGPALATAALVIFSGWSYAQLWSAGISADGIALFDCRSAYGSAAGAK